MTYDLTCVPTDKTVRKQIFPLTLMFLPICVCARRRSSLTLNGKEENRKAAKQENRKSYGNGNGWLCPFGASAAAVAAAVAVFI